MSLWKKANAWLFYWGSNDERLRAGADRAGHVAFMIMVPELLALTMLLAMEVPIDRKALFGLVAAMTLLPIVVYCGLWMAKGLTFMDTKTQKRALQWLLAACPFIFAGVNWLVLGPSKTGTVAFWLATAISAVLGTLAVVAGWWLMQRTASKRAEKAASVPDDLSRV